METILQKKLSIDKTKWIPVKFEEVVFEPKESSKDPFLDGIKHVVGLEHIESENIHLLKSQTLEKSTTFTKKFAIGDVLFGRRRAYLRKASQASFCGICSGDITVFRTNEKLISDLLPFVVTDEKFFNHAIKHSAGGLSPRVKFTDLGKYEFLLPPKKQQTQLAKLLWAMDDVIVRDKELLRRGNILFKKKLENLIIGVTNDQKIKFEKKNGVIQSKLPQIPLRWSYALMKNEIWFQEGPGVRTTQFRESGVKLLNGTNINNNKLNLKSTNRYITEKEAYGTYKHFLCDDGDLIIACSGITVERFNEKITFVRKKHLPLCMNTSTMRFKEKSGNISLEFFKYFLMSNLFKYQINRLVTGSAQLNFGPSHMEKVYLPICSINEQKKIVDELNLLRKSNLLLENKIKTSQSLQKSLINQIF